jgi:hypothetical protein
MCCKRASLFGNCQKTAVLYATLLPPLLIRGTCRQMQSLWACDDTAKAVDPKHCFRSVTLLTSQTKSGHQPKPMTAFKQLNAAHYCANLNVMSCPLASTPQALIRALISSQTLEVTASSTLIQLEVMATFSK